MSVLVVGSANMDYVIATERFPRPGESVFGHSFLASPGGKGANQAVASARMGVPTAFCGRVGADAAAELVRKSLTDAGVNLDFLREDPEAHTGAATIALDAQGQNMIVIAPGANDRVSAADVRAALAIRPSVGLVQLETGFQAIEALLASVIPVRILNPAPAKEIPDAWLALATWVTPNETETEALSGILPVDADTRREAVAALRARGASNVLLTLGGEGVWFAPEGSPGEHLPAIPVQPVDTTAAGDALNGSFAAFLAEGRSPREAIGLAQRAAAIAVTRRGAQMSMPSREEI